MKQSSPIRSVSKAFAAFAVMSAPLWFASASASADTSSLVDVPQGVGSQVLQQSSVFGNTPADTPVTVSIILRAQHEDQLQQLIQSQSTPGSPNFRRFLSVKQFAEQFGQPTAVIQAITAYLAHFGIQTSVYPDNLAITADGTAGQFDQAFDVILQDMSYHGKTFHGAREPKLPGPLAGPILAVLGLTNYGNFASHAVKQVVPTQSGPQSSAAEPHGLLPSDLEKRYDVAPLIAEGDLGQGQTIGIVTLAALNVPDAYTYWQDIGVDGGANRITVTNVDGGPGAPSLDTGSDETALDVEQSGAIAPRAHIIVYQAPNTDYGFADAFFTAVNQNQAGSISASWGMSEDAVNYIVATGQESVNYSQVFNEIAEQAAAQGISMFAAAGDAGAYDASRDLGTTDLSVDTPADSPYFTAAGGTTLPGTQNYGSLGVVTVPAERAWGWDYLWPVLENAYGVDEATAAESFVAGGGGGYSAIYGTPWYQQGVPGVNRYSAVDWLTPTQNNTAWTFHSNPPIVQGTGSGRNVPDLSMDADPQTGYAVYSQLFGGGGWSQYGGTSFVAPQLAGITALINEYAGQRVGFWNGQIYRFATSAHSPFTPLNATGSSNDNEFYTGTAGTVYNPATGLGTPDVYALAQAFKGTAGGPHTGH
ncbi:MAG: S53 family peptidase [Alicyclobacillus sp.]|nr:S53 family peptidase [Alicyclobacillus sp.]